MINLNVAVLKNKEEVQDYKGTKIQSDYIIYTKPMTKKSVNEVEEVRQKINVITNQD